jgi:signal transduction histidine kinase
MNRRVAALFLPLLLLIQGFVARAALADDRDLATYAHGNTRALVRMVESAARLMETQGEAAFAAFSRPESDWKHDDVYLFAYAPDGTCLFNALEPSLAGKNLMDLKDANGRPMIRYITDVAAKPGPEASGWVFYLWEQGAQLIPAWKGAYVRKVLMPDHKVVLVGSGLYDIRIEKVFVQDAVDRAAALIQSEGKDAAFRAFRDKASPFNFLNTYIFVLDGKGRALVDPAFPSIAGRDVMGFQDALGLPVFAELFEKLKTADQAWIEFLWPRAGGGSLARRLMYVRRTRVGGEEFIVGSDFVAATPIWMRVSNDPKEHTWRAVPQT